MNYRHLFHAGNFADVFKHIVLTRILDYLARKETPYRFIDTHAGNGFYDLASEEAQRTGEWLDGIGRFVAAEESVDVRRLVAPYRAVVEPLFLAQPPVYPGSPAFAAHFLRGQDKLIFCDAYPPAVADLERHFAQDRRAKVIEIDGYTALNAFVPPVERRGVVFIDPPFEAPDEFQRLGDYVELAWRKWATGIYVVWFPIKDTATIDAFLQGLIYAGIERLLLLELHIDAPQPMGKLVANALAIINPPYLLEAEANILLPHLVDVFGLSERAGFEVAMLAGA
jgi:23S rRNA (adenine2030-N6)-methyltransferase